MLSLKKVRESIEDIWGEVPSGRADHRCFVHSRKSGKMVNTPLPLQQALQVQFAIE
jgi:hypothetical protein